MLAQHTLDTRDDSGKITGRCSLWWENTPSVPGHRVGLIGHFHAEDDHSATQLLHQATEALKEAGCSLALGPMDGDSWHSYRATTWAGSEAPFAMEPDTGLSAARYFTAAGFELYSRYISAQMDIEGARISMAYRLLAWFLCKRFTLRNIDLDNYDTELERIHRFCCQSFIDNHLYTPIDEADFKALYTPLKPHVRPEFVFIVEKAGKMAGLLFAIPDLNQQQRGEKTDRLIFKTLAVAPDMRGRGIAFLLMYRGYRAAKAAGLRSIIHALMYHDNRSQAFSGRNDISLIREYGLFAREL